MTEKPPYARGAHGGLSVGIALSLIEAGEIVKDRGHGLFGPSHSVCGAGPFNYVKLIGCVSAAAGSDASSSHRHADRRDSLSNFSFVEQIRRPITAHFRWFGNMVRC